MDNPAYRALATAGERAAAIGEKFAEQDMRRRREAQAAKLTTDAAFELFQAKMAVVSDPNFFTNPVETANGFAPQIKGIQQKYLDQIKDPEVKAVFTRQFGQEALRTIEYLATQAHTQSQHVDRGSYLEAINKYKHMADQDPDPHDAMDSLVKAQGLYNRMEEQGLIEPEKKQKEVETMQSQWAHNRIRRVAIDDPDAALSMLADATGKPNSRVTPLEAGNIDLGNRPMVTTADGKTATVRSMSFEEDGKEVLVPTVSDDGRIMSDSEAVKRYKDTGKHLGKFGSVEDANTYAKDLHEAQEAKYLHSGGSIASMLKGGDADGLLKFAEDRRNHKITESRIEAEHFEKKHAEAENNTAYLKAVGDLGNKPPDHPAWDDTIKSIQDNPAGYGLTVDPATQAMKISGDLQTMRKQRQEAIAEGVKHANDKLMNKVLSDKPPSVDEINQFQGADAKGKESAIRWINSDEAKRNRTDAELYGQLVMDIGAHRITEKADLLPYLANGLGKSDFHQLGAMIDTEADPEKAPSLAYAKVAFATHYPNTGTTAGQMDPKAEVGYARFISQYERLVREQGLKGMATHDLADKMLQDVDKHVINTWASGWTTGTALKYYEFWGSWPEPDVRPEPKATPAGITRTSDHPGAPAPAVMPEKTGKGNAVVKEGWEFSREAGKRAGLPDDPKNVEFIYDHYYGQDPEFYKHFRFQEGD
jgi:hypothetical protein